MLRTVGEAIIAWADAREAAHAERSQRRALQRLPSQLRRDLGLGPLDIRPSHWDRW